MRHIRPDRVFEVLQKSILADGMKIVFDPDKSKGARIHDSWNNRDMIDFFSFFASLPIGFGHPKLGEKDFENELLRAAKSKVTNSDIYTTALANFVDTFHRKAAPNFDKLFFIEGGGLAVENALKTAMDWKVQKNLKAGKRGEVGTQVLHFKEAFHGRTGYTLSLTNTSPEKVRYFQKFDWPRVSNPKCKFPLNDENLADVKHAEEEAIKEIKKAFIDRQDEICAIIIEPVQGEGGDNHFRKEFHQTLRQLADENEALLIYDEVQTGMGITGKMWAHEHFGIQPDIICFGKKSQVCGIAVKMDKLNDVENVFKVSSRINSTWGGNIVDMVRCTQYLDIIEEEKLLENAEKIGGIILRQLQEMSQENAFMTNVRGLGLYIAFDLPSPESRNKFIQTAWNNGAIMLPCGTNSVRMRPVLNLSEDEAQEGLSLVQKTIKMV